MNVTVTLDQQHHIATNERTIELSSSVSVVQICKYIYASYLKNRIGKLGGWIGRAKEIINGRGIFGFRS